jgi:hypothetical protein
MMMRAFAISAWFALGLLPACSAEAPGSSEPDAIGTTESELSSAKARCDTCRDGCRRECNGTPLENAYCDQARITCTRGCMNTIFCRIAYPNVRSGGGGEGASE